MMFAVASVKRAETAFPGLHGAVEVVTRGRHVEQLSGREHLAVPGDARPMARILRLPRLHGPGVDHRRGLAGEREHEPRQPAFHVLALDLQSKECYRRLRREWADSCNALLPGYAVIDHRSFKARGIERIPTIHEGYASREMEKRGGRGDLCEENRRIQALNRLLDALRAMIGRLSDQAQGILTAVKRRQRPSGAPQAPSSPEPAERPQERPQARETPPQAPQEPPKPIRTKKALTDRFKTRLDERLAENERKQAEKQAEPDMEETWDLSDPADPLNIGMGWGTGGHGLGL